MSPQGSRMRCWVAAACVMACSWASAADVTDAYPRAAAAYVIAVDGEEYWARNADEPHAPASLTKLMTAIVLLHEDWNPRAILTVSPSAGAIRGSRVGLRAGERLHAVDALAAMLIRSANDACLALAEHRSGTAAAFVSLMNLRARELGLRATTFRNPCGLDAPGQRSSARDLLTLAGVAQAYPSIVALAGVQAGSLTTLAGRELHYTSTNLLLGRVTGANGLKTGYTAQAGHCLIAHTNRDGVELTMVLLDARDRWWTAAALTEEAYREARSRAHWKAAQAIAGSSGH